MNLVPVGADAAERSTRPGFAGGSDEELFLAAFFQERVIGGGKMERLRGEREGGKQTDEGQSGCGRSVHERKELETFLERAFLDALVQAADDPLGFLARGIGCENQPAIADDFVDDGRSQPAGLSKLAEDGEALATVGEGGLFEPPGALPVELDLDGEAARLIDDGRGGDVALVANGVPLDVEIDGTGPENRDRCDPVVVGRINLEVQAEGAQFRLCPGGAPREKRHHQKKIEPRQSCLHIAVKQTHPADKVKKSMGQQSNKVQKRRRREALNKRRNAAAKAKIKSKPGKG